MQKIKTQTEKETSNMKGAITLEKDYVRVKLKTFETDLLALKTYTDYLRKVMKD